MRERLQKILSARGLASRRHAEQMIIAGRVTCNGTICSLGDTADPESDAILVDGKPIPNQESYVYIMLNKPKGYVTTMSDEKGRKNAYQLVSGCGMRVYPVGRLDMDSEGLLIFTNDGDFANQLMHPKNEVNKTYRVWVKGYSKAGFERLKMPIVLDGYRIKPPDICLIAEGNSNTATTELQITIHEGRNRQVRRMCAAAGMRVVKLVRISEGSVKLGSLKIGSWRYLSDAEVAELRKLHCNFK